MATYRLYQELGPEDCLTYLEDMHFKGLEEADYKYDTTCLGGFTKGTTAVEMAAGYATLANDGKYRTPTCIVKIMDAEKNILVPDDRDQEQIYSTNAARMMTDVLESCVTDSGGTARGCALDVDMPVACKTGTTSNYVDGWLCGYSPYYTTAVWVGMDVYEEVDNLRGNTYPAYIWKNFMDKAHLALPEKEFSSYLGEPEETTTEKKVTTEKENTEVETEVEDDALDKFEEQKKPDATTAAPQNPETGNDKNNGGNSNATTSAGGNETKPDNGGQTGEETGGAGNNGGTSGGGNTDQGNAEGNNGGANGENSGGGEPGTP